MHPLYSEFAKLLESEQKDACVRWVQTKLAEKSFSIMILYTEILTPVLNVIGGNENDFLAIWHEHVKTSIVRSIIENSYLKVLEERDKLGKMQKAKVLVMCPPEEYHGLGARMVADFFTIAGFETTYIGENTPLGSVESAIKLLKPVYVAISITNPYHLFSTQKIVALIRKTDPSIKILIGGNATRKDPQMAQKVGADLQLASVSEIMQLGSTKSSMEAN